jgi:DNA-directed RNA polymerase subunit M/transcription elongation factor TFIIS
MKKLYKIKLIIVIYSMTEEEYKYNCEKCNYHTNRKNGFLQHKRTKKHKKNYEDELKEIEKENMKKKISLYIL